MKIPNRIKPLVDDGLVDEVVSRLMSGKEADVYVVRCGSDIRCAKVYKEAAKRSFKKAVQYQEGRKVRNSRRQRAIEKGSKFGRKQQEETWQNAEVDALYRLDRIGVRVPKPFICVNGVLLMELVTDHAGHVAPRLSEIDLSPEQALIDHGKVMHYVVLMLESGIIHGDLSEFNVLMDDKGPVIIDLPQAIDAAANNNAQMMLARDVNNMRDYYGQFAPQLKTTNYAKEIWNLYVSGDLNDQVQLTGQFAESTKAVNVDSVLLEIEDANFQEQQRLLRLNYADED